MTDYLPQIIPALVGIATVFILIMGFVSILKAWYIKVPQGTALIINGLGGSLTVSFTGALVYPVINKKEYMRISLLTLEVDRRGKDGLICRDNMRADITVAFYLRVNETTQDVLKVAKSLGADRASDKQAVNDLFNAKFSEALKTVGKQIEFIKLFENRQEFREKIIEVIGDDLNGYILEDVAIDYLEQTPKSSLDPSNILDAEGIKKITELTATQNIRTNVLERDEQLAIKKKDVETTEAMLALERQEADAQAKQEREIATLRAREEAETKKVQEEERQKSEAATIAVDQDLSVKTENQKREIEVAEQNRLRAVVIEQEKVTRARDLEVVSREREVELQRIDAEKAVEVEKKEIANIIRERVVVDKSVAIEEERIKEVREVSEADRQKQVQVLAAEAQADEEKVKYVKAAEAQELAAKHKAVEITTIAQAELEAAAKEADSKKKLAEGVQAERAAPGLADAKVQEAKADALEKEGCAEARVIDAKGAAEATAKKGIGLAGADVTREQFKAEAEGLMDKFQAMGTMSDDAREHEEFRMSLETALKEALASIEAGKEIARENAEVLATALKESNIDIVGGDDHFFNNFSQALSMGKAIDGLASKSTLVSGLVERFVKRPIKTVNKENVDAS
jgi:uncharacterized membrane protein YqiK